MVYMLAFTLYTIFTFLAKSVCQWGIAWVCLNNIINSIQWSLKKNKTGCFNTSAQLDSLFLY